MRASRTKHVQAWPAVTAALILGLALTAAGAGQGLAATRPATATHSGTATHLDAGDLPAGVRRACAAPTPGHVACLVLVRTNIHASAKPDLVAPEVYDPANLQNAYDLSAASAARGAGETVAVVDAYNDPDAASDLAVYRAQWGLPACDAATGAGCVTIVNEHGAAHPLPGADFTGGWEGEESLDMDMVSAICPNCHILLVEASSELTTDLGTAEDTAVRLGAKFISNSWGGYGQESYNHYFNHPGVAITVAAGDSGFGTSYPASTQFVTSVGGTTLIPAAGTTRGWRETAWSLSQDFIPEGTGSGCSQDPDADAKPAWQSVDDNAVTGCLNRTDNDVSAVADPNSPVWFYDSFNGLGGAPGWNAAGGTSVASPIIAAVYALAGVPKPGTYPASYLYQSGHAASLYPVTSGRDGFCQPAYQCDAGDDYPGTTYNAPTGWGTPDGTAAFTDTATADVITVNDPGTQDILAGTRLRLPVSAVDSGTGQQLRFSAVGLPAGMSIAATTGVISGRAAAVARTSRVTVTAVDGTGAAGSVSFDIVSIPSLRAAYRPVTGPVTLHVNYADRDDMCLYARPGQPGAAARVEVWKCDGRAAEMWTYRPDADPDSSGTLVIYGQCATLASDNHKVSLRPCAGEPNQGWSLQAGTSLLYNPASGLCLNDPMDSRGNGTQVNASFCYGTYAQSFILPPGPVLSAVGGTCLTDPGNSSAGGVQMQARRCNGSAAQSWDVFSSWVLPVHNRLCLSAAGNPDGQPGVVPGVPVELVRCSISNNDWLPLADGQIMNGDVGLCLDDPGSSSGRPARLVLAQCYGTAGELWAEG